MSTAAANRWSPKQTIFFRKSTLVKKAITNNGFNALPWWH